MDPALPEELLKQLSELISVRMGLNFPPDRFADLTRGIEAAARDLGCREVTECAALILSSKLTPAQLKVLSEHLTVGETYFFREKATIAALEQEILPRLIQEHANDRCLRIWSAGCCSGEEPYTIAISLRKLLPEFRSWNVTILGTDLNSKFLQKASRGVYNEWSFRSTPTFLKQRFFKPLGKQKYEIIPEIKSMVTFASLNLADDVYPSLLNNTNAMDLILCRNVLMYFTPEQAQKVIGQFHSSLVDGGWLIVSAAETSSIHYNQFTAQNVGGTTVYRKRGEEQKTGSPTQSASSLTVSMEHSPLLAARSSSAKDSGKPFERAKVSYEKGDYLAAIHDLNVLYDQDPADTEVLALLARAHANRGELFAALQWCDRAIEANKLVPSSHYLKGTILMEQRSFERSRESFNRALYLDPDFILAHFALGNLALKAIDGDAADRHFENALLLLRKQPPERTLPASDGITAKRLQELIETAILQEDVT